MSAQNDLQDIFAISAASMRIGRESALDEAWHLINAQGGYSAPDDIAGTAHNEAIGVALDIIEKLGGMDPLQRGKE